MRDFFFRTKPIQMILATAAIAFLSGAVPPEVQHAQDERAVATHQKPFSTTAIPATAPNVGSAKLGPSTARTGSVLDFRIAVHVTRNEARVADNEIAAGQATLLIQKFEEKSEGEPPETDKRFSWFETNDEGNAAASLVTAKARGKNYILLCTSEPLVMLAGPAADRKWGIKRASVCTGLDQGKDISFDLDEEGGELFGKFTNANRKKPMAILIDNKVILVATIMSKIKKGVRISNGEKGFDPAEASRIVDAITRGMAREAATQPTPKV